MSILDSLPGIINGALGSLVFRNAVLKVPGERSSDGQGGYTNDDPDEYACKALVDDFSDYRRQASGIPANDRKIIILAASAGIKPKVGHTITAEGRDWQIVSLVRDPAGATYEAQAR